MGVRRLVLNGTGISNGCAPCQHVAHRVSSGADATIRAGKARRPKLCLAEMMTLDSDTRIFRAEVVTAKRYVPLLPFGSVLSSSVA